MKRLLLVGIIIFLSCPPGLCKNYKYFPTNFDGDSLELAEKDLGQFEDAMIALSGTVDQIKKSYRDKPYLQITLNENNPHGRTIWVGSIMGPSASGGYSLGDEIRALGYMSENHSDTLSSKFNKDGFHVLGICIVNVTTKSASFREGLESIFEEWKSGAIPQEGE